MTYAALLGGINVGGRNIKMPEIKACFEGLDLKNVQTVLASGNVIFDSDSTDTIALRSKIEAGLTVTFSYPAYVHVISLTELQGVIKNFPFATGEPDYHAYVIFFSEPAASDRLRELVMPIGDEQVQHDQKVTYWRVSRGMTLDSSFAKQTAKLKVKTTTRNLNTLQKIVVKAST